MRTNIDIDDRLLTQAMKLARSKNKKETVHLALEELIRAMKRETLARLKGKVIWKGNLSQMRRA